MNKGKLKERTEKKPRYLRINFHMTFPIGLKVILKCRSLEIKLIF